MHWLKDIHHLPDLFRLPVFLESGTYYRPILMMSFMFDALLGNGDPSFFHFSNVFYHIITTMLLFYLMQLMGLPKLQAFVLSLLFSVRMNLPSRCEGIYELGRSGVELIIYLNPL